MINVNQITSQLAKMPDPLLQKFAAMHKNDPYTVSLALSESNRRKEMRADAQARMGGQQQPKVVDQEVAQMLPEEVGIGQLPAQNLQKMAGGGIVAFEEGGEVDRYQNKGLTESGMNPFAGVPRELSELILATAAKYKIDPNIAMRLVKQESGFDPNAVSGAGAVGLTQLRAPAAQEMGLHPDERTNPAKNLDAGFGYLRKQLNKYGDDYSKALSAFNWGGGNVDKHIKKNEGTFSRVGLPKETADYLTKILPMGSAGAGELPKEGAGAKAVAAAAPAAPAVPAGDSRPWYDRGRDLMQSGEAQLAMLHGVQDVPAALLGAPVDVSHYIANQFGRTPVKGEKPFMGSKWIKEKLENMGMRAPESTNPDLQAIRSGTEGVASLYNPLDKATKATKLTQEGIAALGAENKAAAVSKAQQEAELSGALGAESRLAADEAAAQRAALAAEGPTKAASIQKANEIAAAQRAPVARELNKVGEASVLANTDVDATMAAAAGKRKDEKPAGVELDKDAIDKIKEGAAETGKTSKGGIGDLFNDPMFLMGMQMMASQNPRFVGALGEAGLGTAKHLSEQRKAEAERGYYGAKGAEAQATADYLNRGAKDRNMALEAEKLIQNHMTKWGSSQAGQLAALKGDNAAMLEEQRVRNAIYQQLGISPTMVTGGGMPNLGAADAALINKYLKK